MWQEVVKAPAHKVASSATTDSRSGRCLAKALGASEGENDKDDKEKCHH